MDISIIVIIVLPLNIYKVVDPSAFWIISPIDVIHEKMAVIELSPASIAVKSAIKAAARSGPASGN